MHPQTGTVPVPPPRLQHDVTFVDHSSRPGGGQLSLLRYLRAEPAAAQHARLVVFEDGMLAEGAREAGVRTVVLPRGSRLRRRRALEHALRGSDLVVVNSLKAAYYTSFTAMRGRRHVYYMREDLSRGWLTGARRVLALGWSLRRFDAFIANSRWTESTLTTGLSRRPHAVAYPVSGVEVTAHRGPASRDLRILSLSRLNEWKGVHVLVDALALLDADAAGATSVTIAGDDVFKSDPYTRELRARAARSGVRVDFPGHVDDVAPLLRDHDVLVSCSLLPEPFGQVIVQGLASRMVVVATAMGGPKEVIESGVDGVLVPEDDPEALAEVLHELIADPSRRDRLGEAAGQAASPYVDLETVAALSATLNRFAKMLAGPSNRSSRRS